MKHEFHNPDNLTPEQVGEGYRLLLKSEFGRQEEQHQEIETWLEPRKEWHKSKIGYLGNSKFCTYRVPLSTWPLPEEDPHRELKEAHAAGKTLQWKFKGAETWMTKTANFDDYPDNCDYRIKQEEPWTLGRSVNGFTLGEGQQWRKTRDPWAWDDLPPTFRPFTTLDVITVGDQFHYHDETEWLTIAEGGSDIGEKPSTSHKFRTRRPLPTPEIPWIEWHGGECPLKDEEVEEWAYMARDGFTCSSPSAPSCYTPYWEHNAGADDIITYRVLKWKEKPYAAPPVKSPEVHELQERFAEPQLTYHQWRGEPRDQESPPTDNDPWECLLRTNANLGREVSELKKQRDVLSSQLQGVITACHLRGYNVGASLGEWIEKQFEDAQARLAQLEK